MKKLISLIKVDLNISFGLSSLAYNFNNKKNRWTFIILTLALLSLLPSYIFIVNTLYKAYDIYSQIGQKSVFLLLGTLTSQLLIFLLGILYVMSKYYFSNDLAHLIPMPIKPSYIIGSKFATVMVSEYLTSLPIILPFLLIYGVKSAEGFLYWLYSILIILTIPIIPLVLASILVMVFMKYTNIGAKKDLIRVIGAAIFIFVLVFIQFKIQLLGQRALIEGEDFLLNLVGDSNLLVKTLGNSFPPAKWAALALINYKEIAGIINLGLFVLVGLISFLIMIYLSETIFLDGLIGNTEFSRGGKTKKQGSGSRIKAKKSRPYISLCRKELLMLLKTPIYLFNSLGVVIILPLVLIMPMIVTSDNSTSEIILKMSQESPQLISLIGIGFISIQGIFNNVGSTTFSREGKSLWIQRTMPIKVKYQIFGRVLASLCIQVVAIFLFFLALVFIIRPSLENVLIISILGLLGSIPMTQIGMVIDIIRPLLDWDNPQKAVKQNLNVLISMGVSVLYGGGIFYLIKYLLDKMAIYAIYTLLASIFVISGLALFYLLKYLIDRQFQLLE